MYCSKNSIAGVGNPQFFTTHWSFGSSGSGTTSFPLVKKQWTFFVMAMDGRAHAVMVAFLGVHSRDFFIGNLTAMNLSTVTATNNQTALSALENNIKIIILQDHGCNVHKSTEVK